MLRFLLLGLGLLAASAQAAELTVVSFNIRYAAKSDTGKKSWETRQGLVVETIKKLNPDLIGVQEALAPQLDYLAKALPAYEPIGVGRDDGKRRGEYSALLIRKERLERDPDEGGTFWMSDTPEKAGSSGWGNRVVRICTWARVVDKRTRKGVYIYNTHWDHQHQGSREKSGRLISQRIDARKRKFEPVIVTGDFNATETNPGVAYLLGKNVELAGGEGAERWASPLRSTFLELHADVVDRRTFNGWNGNREGPHMIDHILISKGWTTRKSWIEYHQKDGVWPSDHYPVAAVIELAK